MLKINNEKVSFSCLGPKKKKYAEGNVCESVYLFICGQAAVCALREAESRVLLWAL